MEMIRLKAVPVYADSGSVTGGRGPQLPIGASHLYISYINKNGIERILEGGPDRNFLESGAVLKKQPEKQINTRLRGEYRPEAQVMTNAPSIIQSYLKQYVNRVC